MPGTPRAGMEEIEDLEASIYFLENNEIYRTEKPYHLQYPISGVERSNLRTQKNEHIPIRDLRGREDEISFENNGIAILEMETSMTYEEFNDKEKLKNVYCEEVGNALLQYTGAKEVQIYDFDVRRRLPGFPFSVIQPLLQDIQPALAAHIPHVIVLIPLYEGSMGTKQVLFFNGNIFTSSKDPQNQDSACH
ncbi:hypothetical protein V8E51_003726 [Hyaloscypha variabilis]